MMMKCCKDHWKKSKRINVARYWGEDHADGELQDHGEKPLG